MDKTKSKYQAQVIEYREGEAMATGSSVAPAKGHTYAALQLQKNSMSLISSTDKDSYLSVSFLRIESKWRRYLSNRNGHG